MEANCPICSKASVQVAKLADGVLLKCPSCHWLFATCTPKGIVKSNQEEEKKNEYLAITQKASLLSGLSGGDKVLDIHSGDGILLGWYLQNTITAGVEPDAKLMSDALNNKRIDIAVVQEFGPRTMAQLNHVGKFKIITVVDVLQNMDFMETIQACLELLSPEGVIVIQTPYFLQDLREKKIVPARNYTLAFTYHQLFQRLGLEFQGLEMPKRGVRVYVTRKEFKRFGTYDFDLKLRLYTQMNSAIISELHERFDLESTYARVDEPAMPVSRNAIITYPDA